MTHPVAPSDQKIGEQAEAHLAICALSDALCPLWEMQVESERQHRGKWSAPELPAFRQGVTDLVVALMRAHHYQLPQDDINDAMLQHLPPGLFERLTNIPVAVGS